LNCWINCGGIYLKDMSERLNSTWALQSFSLIHPINNLGSSTNFSAVFGPQPLTTGGILSELSPVNILVHKCFLASFLLVPIISLPDPSNNLIVDLSKTCR